MPAMSARCLTDTVAVEEGNECQRKNLGKPGWNRWVHVSLTSRSMTAFPAIPPDPLPHNPLRDLLNVQLIVSSSCPGATRTLIVSESGRRCKDACGTQ